MPHIVTPAFDCDPTLTALRKAEREVHDTRLALLDKLISHQGWLVNIAGYPTFIHFDLTPANEAEAHLRRLPYGPLTRGPEDRTLKTLMSHRLIAVMEHKRPLLHIASDTSSDDESGVTSPAVMAYSVIYPLANVVAIEFLPEAD